MAHINITVNGQARTIDTNTNLAQLIEQLQEELGQESNTKALATAVNEEFVARHARQSLILKENDAVFTFQPITGG